MAIEDYIDPSDLEIDEEDCGEILYRVLLSNAVFGLRVKYGKVVGAAPIAQWSVGKDFNTVKKYFSKIGGAVTRVKET